MKMSIIILFLILVSCNPNEYSTNYRYTYLDNEIKITAKSSVKDILKVDLSKLFDNNKATVWTLNNTKDLQIEIVFNKPIYLYSIIGRLINNNLNIQQSFIQVVGQSDEYNMPNIYEKISFSKDRFEFKQNPALFKTKKITLYFYIFNDSISMSEIDLFTNNSSNYIPKYSFEDINNFFVNNNKKDWEFDDPNKAIDQDILKCLVYYSLNGNTDAEKILYNFNPSGAADGEIYSALIRDYKNSKNK